MLSECSSCERYRHKGADHFGRKRLKFSRQTRGLRSSAEFVRQPINRRIEQGARESFKGSRNEYQRHRIYIFEEIS
jgi:hypothetical protein